MIYRNIYLNINGYARHGKDTVGDLFQKWGLKKASASHFYAQMIMEDNILGPYDSVEECYEDRVNHRSEWYDYIRSITKEDPYYFVSRVLERGHIYCGHRARYEFEKTKELFDATIWVDASGRGLPKEDVSSCDLTLEGHDFVIDNSKSIEHTQEQCDSIIQFILNERKASNAYS